MNFYKELRDRRIIEFELDIDKMEDELKVVSFKMKEKDVEQLDKIAQQLNMSRSQLIRYFIKKGMEEFI